ncbi:hypothetical protein K3726_10565 [Leisingera caerulea]|uniref:Uncharacterized protein n=1 Tax=Leisingera caerulea TaxID=506591 RepID=A0A9Q9M1D8_LEICA|nr:hypothetical protein [Leisingera caerulea]UWQ52463.1 hypothetical protein K3721_10470 [Leisingera caerulea]UWQ82156.1 hypothetical protein K3726_10565 [Leisingera caerulea]
MIGVVLWRDETLTKAVIWCEDQGDLAFYTNEAGAEFQEFNPGDWVEFDLTISGNVRIAGNLAVLIEQGSPDLADRLSAEACAPAAGAEDQTSGAVVPFPVQSAKKRGVSAPLQVRQR